MAPGCRPLLPPDIRALEGEEDEPGEEMGVKQRVRSASGDRAAKADEWRPRGDEEDLPSHPSSAYSGARHPTLFTAVSEEPEHSCHSLPGGIHDTLTLSPLPLHLRASDSASCPSPPPLRAGPFFLSPYILPLGDST
uniref:Uncharacterized protein n=1 Tax=Rangifer tarandus platyrhynchus TaxID=3082113 RepID=A0ACB0DY70_RANTA|nr:unnamed protein product [Rangifer tarandus platyrhynchus]